MPEPDNILSRKRRRQEQPLKSLHSHDFEVPPQKRRRIKYPSPSRPPPGFWDNLSEISLTKRTLQEFDRRDNQVSIGARHPARRVTRRAVGQWREDLNNWHPTEDAAAALKYISKKPLKDVRAFSKHGGPDLSDLRGYRRPADPREYMMGPTRTQKSKSQKQLRNTTGGSSPNLSGQPTQTAITKKSSPYDRDFQQNLIDGGVYPIQYEFPDGRIPPRPDNLEEINRRSLQNRPSLSPTRFPDAKFEEFQRADGKAKKEAQVTRLVIPFIEGKIADPHCTNGHIPFTNLDHLTDGKIVPGNPDVYYGSRPEQLNPAIREKLSGQIIPSTQLDLPIAPNFFLAVKGPAGSNEVAQRQVAYDGALGARGIHSLQSYAKHQPTYDNKAYTITTSYHAGVLKIYTSHPGAPSSPGGRPEYCTTQVRALAMCDTPSAFRQGAAVYRNLMDWAKEQRDEAIRQANAKFAATSPDVLPVEASNISTGTTLATDASEEPSAVESLTQECQRSLDDDVGPSAHRRRSESSSDEPNTDEPDTYEAPAKRGEQTHGVFGAASIEEASHTIG